MGKPKIFVWTQPYGHDVIGYALAEDGVALASHLSSSEMWARHDMGIDGDWKHDRYRAHYPDGYELVWLGGEPSGDEFEAAFALHKAATPAQGGGNHE